MGFNSHTDSLSREQGYYNPPTQTGSLSPDTTPSRVDKGALFQLGLSVGAVFRHFKGDYYVVRSVDYDSEDTRVVRVSYQAVKPPYETWSRPATDFLSEVPEGRTSITGQKMRFQMVVDFQPYPLSGVPTPLLVDELKKRVDNPYRNESGVSEVVVEDYVVGQVLPPLTEEDRLEVNVLSSFNDIDKARDWAERHRGNKTTLVFRRVFFSSNGQLLTNSLTQSIL